LLETTTGDRHDARLFVGEIDLIGWHRTGDGRRGRPAAGLLARGFGFGLARCKLGFMLGLLARESALC